MGKTATTTGTSKRKALKPLVHRGVVILPPMMPPSVPIERLMEAARKAFERHPYEPSAAE